MSETRVNVDEPPTLPLQRGLDVDDDFDCADAESIKV